MRELTTLEQRHVGAAVTLVKDFYADDFFMAGLVVGGALTFLISHIANTQPSHLKAAPCVTLGTQLHCTLMTAAKTLLIGAALDICAIGFSLLNH